MWHYTRPRDGGEWRMETAADGEAVRLVVDGRALTSRHPTPQGRRPDDDE